MSYVYKFVRKDPDKAYVDNMLWLPISRINKQAVKNSLEFWGVEKGEATKREIWSETEHHIVTPREFIKPELYPNFNFPFVDLTPKKFLPNGLDTCIVLRDEVQERAYRAFEESHGGVLNLSPGKGKTVLALKKIVDSGWPALIVVHNTYLLEQWKEKIAEFIILPPNETVGIIQGKKFDWKHPITVAMIHSLAGRSDKGFIDREFGHHFGIVIFDEVHHLSAPMFEKTAPIVRGQRFGLTATPQREDGMEFIYKYHIGGIFYKDTESDIIPKIYFQRTPISLDLDDPDVRRGVFDISGTLNIPKLRSFMGRHEESNRFRYRCIKEAVDKGRKIICLSHSKDLVINLHRMFPGSGIIINETPQSDRTGIVRSSQLVFAISRLGGEGLDDPALDTLFYLTPFSSSVELEQSIGRMQRHHEGKKHPVVVMFEDDIGPFRGMCFKIKKLLQELGFEYEILDIPIFGES